MIIKYTVLICVLAVYINCQDAETNEIDNGLSTDKNIDKELVKIQLYYECLCPDCRNFDTMGFKDTIVELASNLDVHVYPFGNARILQDGTITCQHGPKECYGNMLHACAIQQLKNITLSVLYNSCLMDYSQTDRGSNDAAADVCGKSMDIDSESIKSCAKGKRGLELLRYYGEESKKVTYDGVPYVLINGKPGDEYHFKNDVCKAFKNPPEPCHKRE